ncbi:MAG: hypothetical protein AAF609_10760 [Cyanobacteria bacterium P01_C01_bin.120]
MSKLWVALSLNSLVLQPLERRRGHMVAEPVNGRQREDIAPLRVRDAADSKFDTRLGKLQREKNVLGDPLMI